MRNTSCNKKMTLDCYLHSQSRVIYFRSLYLTSFDYPTFLWVHPVPHFNTTSIRSLILLVSHLRMSFFCTSFCTSGFRLLTTFSPLTTLYLYIMRYTAVFDNFRYLLSRYFQRFFNFPLDRTFLFV